MGRWFRKLVSANAAKTAARANSRFAGPVRLIIASAVALCIVVVVGASLVVLNLRSRTLAENERTLSNSALILAKQIEQTFKTVEAVQRGFTDELSHLSSLDNESITRQLASHDVHVKLRHEVAGMPYVASLTIFNADGRAINTSRRWPAPDISVADRDYFVEIKRDPTLTSFLGAPLRSRATGALVLHLTRRISGPNGEFLGIVAASVDVEYLQNYFGEISAEPNSSVALFRNDGAVLARFPINEVQIGRRFPTVIALKLVSNSDHGVGVSPGVIDGAPRMVAAHRVSSYPMVITATRTVVAILASWWKTATYIACAAFLTVAIIMAFAVLFTRLFRNYQALLQARNERNKAEQLREQSLRFDVALNNMSQGLIMFDAWSNIVVCNSRFIEIYGVSRDVVKPGLSLLNLLKHRKATGSFSGDPNEYYSKLLKQIAKRTLTVQNAETPDGRIIKIANQPMPGGGWVATHEDITEKVAAENELRKQEEQLNAALENISQGVCMFDASQRLIICNKQYADLYGMSDEQTKPGTPLHVILEHRIAGGNAPEDYETYIRDRLNEVTVNQPYETINRLRDGRYVAVVHRPMGNGGWVATHQDITEARQREESFRLLFEGNPVPMWVIDRKSLRFLAVNEAALAHYGFSRDQFMSMTVADLRPFEDRARFVEFMHTLSDNQFVENIGQHTKADGTQIDVAICSKLLIYNGTSARLAAIHDITKTKRTESELQRTKLFLDAVIEHVPVPIVVRDVEGLGTDTRANRFTLFNRAYEDLTGDNRSQLIGKTAHEIYPAERADIVVRSDDETLRTDQVVCTPEHQIPTVRNGIRLVTAKKTAIRDENGQPQYLLTVLDDVTERRRAEQRISYLAHNDSLTNLPNRASFLEHLEATFDAASKSGQQFVVMCLDLDHFKEANDVYGHLVGDGLLREAARRLQTAAEGAYLARIGGDEFILVLTGGELPEAAEAVGDRLLAAFKPDFVVDGHRIQVGLSIGAAIFPADGPDVKTLIANADAALYQAKSEVRGSLRFFEAKLGSRLREQREMQIDLRAALDRGDLLLHYQPQSTIGLDKVTGFEALARWQCPKRGMVSPGEFIPVAEQSSLIIPLGEWILREACREAASWPQPLKIGVNISPVQFHHGDLPNLVHSVLLETGLHPERLELEITEGVLIDDFSRAVSILRKLKSLGIHIALDDFGSGYSSLSYLHAFPFEKIKIDRTFIGDLEYNHHSMAIVRAIITLGHSLNIPILAEGVETKTQLSFLAQEGCDEVQGYFTGRPFPIDAYADLIGRKVAKTRDKAVAV